MAGKHQRICVSPVFPSTRAIEGPPESLRTQPAGGAASTRLSRAKAGPGEAGQLPEVLQLAMVEMGFGLTPSSSFCSHTLPRGELDNLILVSRKQS